MSVIASVVASDNIMTTSNSQTELIHRPAPVATNQRSTNSFQSISDFEVETAAERSQNVTDIEDVPPDGGYGWVCTACVFLVNAHTWGVNAAWAIFLAHYLSNDTFPGTTQLEYALIGGLSISQSMLMSPLVSLCNNRFGTRTSLLIGTVVVFGALFAAGSSRTYWQLLLSQGFLYGWGMGFLYLTATALLPAWFSSKRSLTSGIASSGAGLGGLAYNLIIGAILPRVGLEWSFRILALCSLAANGASVLLLRDRNSKTRSAQTAFNWREYLKTETQLILLWGVFTEIGYIVLLYSLPTYATSVGLSHSQGSIISAMLNLGLGIGRPFIGHFSDVFGRINMATIVTFLCALFCLAIGVPAITYANLLVFALLAGICCGIFWNTVAPVTTEVTGLKRFPSVFSTLVLIFVLPTTFAEPIALRIVSASGYVSAQVFVGCMFLAGAASIWCLRSWKLYDIEQKAYAEDWTRSAVPRPGRSNFWLSPRRLFALKRV